MKKNNSTWSHIVVADMCVQKVHYYRLIGEIGKAFNDSEFKKWISDQTRSIEISDEDKRIYSSIQSKFRIANPSDNPTYNAYCFKYLLNLHKEINPKRPISGYGYAVILYMEWEQNKACNVTPPDDLEGLSSNLSLIDSGIELLEEIRRYAIAKTPAGTRVIQRSVANASLTDVSLESDPLPEKYREDELPYVDPLSCDEHIEGEDLIDSRINTPLCEFDVELFGTPAEEQLLQHSADQELLNQIQRYVIASTPTTTGVIESRMVNKSFVAEFMSGTQQSRGIKRARES